MHSHPKRFQTKGVKHIGRLTVFNIIRQIWIEYRAIIVPVLLTATTLRITGLRIKKALSFQYMINTSLLPKSTLISDQYKITYKNKIAADIYVIEIKFQNTGRLAIIESDFTEPIQISFQNNVTIISAEIASVYPDDLKPKCEIENNSIKLMPLLLNKRDTVSIKILVSNTYGAFPIVSARIIDIQRLTHIGKMRLEESYYDLTIPISLFFLIMLNAVVVITGIIVKIIKYYGYPLHIYYEGGIITTWSYYLLESFFILTIIIYSLKSIKK